MNLQLRVYLNPKQLRTESEYVNIHLFEFILLSREQNVTFTRFVFSFSILFFGTFCEIIWKICGNKMPARCNRGFYCTSYCLLNMFRASLCPSSGAQEYYTMVAACGISYCGFQVAAAAASCKPDT